MSRYATGYITIYDVADGAVGPQGPSLIVNSNRPAAFTATDGTLDVAQSDIVFTTLASGIDTPVYVWSFSGDFEVAPTIPSSSSSTATVTAANFGTAKSATVTCTVNSVYVDVVTIVRLETSTAEAGATLGMSDTEAGLIFSPDVTTINGGNITTGSLQANQITTGIGGNRIDINNDSIKVYNNGVLRVVLGILPT